MLRAYFDGSGPSHSNGRYVLAGFVADVSTWTTITEEWEAVLNLTPAIPKFKLALSRNKEWLQAHRVTKEQINQRIKLLGDLVRPPKTLFSVVCSINESGLVPSFDTSS